MPDKIQLKRDTFAVGCIAFPALPDVSLFYALLYAFRKKNIPDAKRFFGLAAADSLCALVDTPATRLYCKGDGRSIKTNGLARYIIGETCRTVHIQNVF